jgi:hypothetical protein
MGVMDPAPAPYLIRINGHLGATLLSAFPALAPHHHGAHTVLTGLLDPSALCWPRSRRSAWICSRSKSSPRTVHHRNQETANHRDGHQLPGALDSDKDAITATHPNRADGRAEKIAAGIHRLLSDQASFVAGVVLNIGSGLKRSSARTSLAGLRRAGYARRSSSTGMVRTPAVWRAYSAKPG